MYATRLWIGFSCTVLLVSGIGSTALAQPAPLSQRVGGAYVGDSTLDAIYLTRDLDQDGDADDAGEATVFFDATNASGLPNPTGSVFTIFQARDRHVFCGDGGSDTVYRLIDLNGDRDAQDEGEAAVWFSAAGNDGGFGLSSPGGCWQREDGSVYLLTAGAGGANDAIYRTADLNADGDAEDAGEATLWMDTQTLVSNSSAFELVFIGDVAFFADLVGGDPDAIYRAEDTDGSGAIEAGEYNVFIDETNPFGVLLGTALVTDGVDLFVSESTSSAFQAVTRLRDQNGSGTIDDAGEVHEVWNETRVPAGFGLSSSFGLAIGPEGELLVGSAGADENDNIFRLVDGNGDGDFLDDGETIVWASGHGSGVFIENPRSLEYAMARPGDANGDDVVSFADLLAVLGDWGPCPGCPTDFNGDDVVNFADILIVLGNWG